jgi:hypothetical protein
MTNSAICETALKVVEKAIESYDKKYKQWITDVKSLTYERDEAKDAYLLADQALADTPTNQTIDNISRGFWYNGDECDTWSWDECDTRCKDKVLYTPGGKKSKVTFSRPDCKGTGRWRCRCHYVESWDASDATQKKNIYELKENLLKNKISQEPKYKDENPPSVQCCSNTIDCIRGVCTGNIQICRNHVTNLAKKENEDIVIQSIKDLQTIFNGLNTNFNQNKNIFKNYYAAFNKINFESKNINLIYNQIKSLYDNITAIFNEIEKNAENMIIYNDSLNINNSRIISNSNLKSDVNTITATADRITQNIINEFQQEILESYVIIKDIFDNIERDNQNYISIISKKNLMDENIKKFNIDIENINNFYKSVNSLNIIEDKDLETFIKLINDIKK